MNEGNTSARSVSHVARAAELLLPGLLALITGGMYMFSPRWVGDSAYYQAISLNAAREGHWWTLHESNIPYFNKPPLGFWMHAATARAFGESDVAARLPELACFALVCVVVGMMARRWAGRFAGIAAGTMMALTWEWFARVGNFRLDFHHTLYLLGCAGCLIRASEIDQGGRGRERLGWVVGAGALLGLALMTKQVFGLGALVIVLGWIGMRASWRGMRTSLRDVGSVAVCGLIGVAMAAPWHVSMIARHGRTFLDQYVLRQSVERATGERFDPEPWWWYLEYLVRREDGTPAWAMWPLLALSIVGAAAVISSVREARAVERRGGSVAGHVRSLNGLGMFALLWTFGWLVMLSLFGDKRHYYMLIVQPGMALLAGVAIADVARRLGLACRVAHDRAVVAAGGGMALGLVLVYGAGGLVTWAPVRVHVELRAVGDWLREQGSPRLVNGGVRYNDAALMYVVTGIWPQIESCQKWVDRESVKAGELMLYDVSTARANHKVRASPDEQDEEVFRNGRFVVMKKR